MAEFKLNPWVNVGNTDGGTFTVKSDWWDTGTAMTSTSTFTTTGTTGTWTTPWNTSSSTTWTLTYDEPPKKLTAKVRKRIIQEVILDHLLRQGS